MSKFNVGDIIRCIEAGYSYVNLGQEYEVKGIDRDGDPEIIDSDGDLGGYGSDVFELVKAIGTISIIADLKTGMRVRTANGRDAIFVLDATGYNRIVYQGISAWDNAYMGSTARHRIVEVYEAPDHAANYLDVSARGKLLWEEKDALKREAVVKAKAKLAEAQAELAAAEAALK